MNALNPVRRVGDQIAEPIEVRLGQSRDASRKRAAELLDLVGIPKKRATAYPHELSGGMRQRAMIAMALACDPAIVIGDEPTTALDVMVQAQILQLLEQLRRDLGLSLMLITHDLSVIAETCDKVMVMYAGRVAEEGPVRRVFTAPRHPYTQELLARTRTSTPTGGRSRSSRACRPTCATRRPAAGSRRAARSRWRSAPRSCRPRSRSPTASGSPATCTRLAATPWRRRRRVEPADARVPAPRPHEPGAGTPVRRPRRDDRRAPSRHEALPDGRRRAAPRPDGADRPTRRRRPHAASRVRTVDGELLRLEDLEVHFPIRRRHLDALTRPKPGVVRAVDGIDLSIRKGEILALVGESGSGKTTTGRVIVKLTRQTGRADRVRRRRTSSTLWGTGRCATTGGGSS